MAQLFSILQQVSGLRMKLKTLRWVHTDLSDLSSVHVPVHLPIYLAMIHWSIKHVYRVHKSGVIMPKPMSYVSLFAAPAMPDNPKLIQSKLHLDQHFGLTWFTWVTNNLCTGLQLNHFVWKSLVKHGETTATPAEPIAQVQTPPGTNLWWQVLIRYSKLGWWSARTWITFECSPCKRSFDHTKSISQHIPIILNHCPPLAEGFRQHRARTFFAFSICALSWSDSWTWCHWSAEFQMYIVVGYGMT